MRTFFAVDPQSGQVVQVVPVEEAKVAAVKDGWAEDTLRFATSEQAFNAKSPLNGNDIGDTYRQGAMDAMAVVRALLGVEG